MSNGWFYIRVWPDKPTGENNRLGPFRRKGRRIFDAGGNRVTYAEINEQRKNAQKTATAATVTD